MDKLTPQEYQAMRALWKAKNGSVHVVLTHHEEPQPHKNTFASTLKNLEKKGLVRHRQIGNAYEYFPAVSRSSYLKKHYKNFLNHFFDNSVEDLLSFIAREKKISEQDIEQIKQLLDKK